MPSPFPGMDPYLEDSRLWRGVHDRLIPLIARAINDALPEGYFADINERVYIGEPRRTILPDVAVLISQPARVERTSVGTANSAVLDRPDIADPSFKIVLGDEIREPFVEILTTADQQRVVTTIEVVSPSNKTPGPGWEQYTAKQRETFDSSTHLMEIDLLRSGLPVLMPPIELTGQRPAYAVCLHRARTGFAFELWVRTVRETLPCVAVPLSLGDADITLDLQRVFDRCYDDGPYSRRVDYGQPPVTPLEADDAEWANALLLEKGLRT